MKKKKLLHRKRNPEHVAGTGTTGTHTQKWRPADAPRYRAGTRWYDGKYQRVYQLVFRKSAACRHPFLKEKFNVDDQAAADLIKSHICLCYDVCHFALVYEAPHRVLDRIRHYGLKIGKLQISAALKADMPADQDARHKVTAAFRQFNEPVYLHQVIARRNDGTFLHYPDLPEALADEENPDVTEWRSHFHVPVFLDRFDVLQSTQEDIRQVLALQQQQPFTAHMEVETYTWDVLPPALKQEMAASVSRELLWCKETLNA